MTDSEALFDLLQRIAALDALSPETAGDALGATFTRDDAESGEASTAFQATLAEGPVATAILARPNSVLFGTACAMRLVLRPEASITKDDVRAAWGLEGRTIMPTPREPPGSPMALWYRRDWADVRFSFPPGEDRMLGVAIDQREPS